MFTSQSNDQKFVKSLEKEIMKFLKPNPKSSNNGSFITTPGSNGLSSGVSRISSGLSSGLSKLSSGLSGFGSSGKSVGPSVGPSSSSSLASRRKSVGPSSSLSKDKTTISKSDIAYNNGIPGNVTIVSSDLVNVLNKFSDITITRSLTDGKGKKINDSICEFGDNHPEGNCSGNDNNPNDTNQLLVKELKNILDSTDDEQDKKIDDFTENIKNKISVDENLKPNLEELKSKSKKNGADILVKIISAIITKLFS